MDPVETPYCNKVLKGPADMPNCIDLPCTQTILDDYPVFQTFWMPTADELRMLREGKPVVLTVYGRAHPPVWVGVMT